MILGVIGLGLIGGSLALSLRGTNGFNKILGFDLSSGHQKKAIELGLIDAVCDVNDLIRKSDVILLAIPVHHMVRELPKILTSLSEKQVIIDFGSTKSAICNAVTNHTNRGQFVAAHPMAGTENTGPEAAIKNLFSNKVNIICEQDLSSKASIELAGDIFKSLGMHTLYMDAEEHDRHIAYVSHLSHISSFMLGLTVLDIEKDEKNIFNMAGSGFQSTVRLAMSSPDMWAPIFDQNSENINKALDTYIEYLKQFRSMINDHDQTGMKNHMERANKIRKILKSDKT